MNIRTNYKLTINYKMGSIKYYVLGLVNLFVFCDVVG